jgi:hypothetical protein
MRAITRNALLLLLVVALPVGAEPPRENGIADPAMQLPWSFQRARTAPPPQVRDEEWSRSDIDRFVLSKLEERGLTPVRDAARLTLIRRAAFDLTGLPPSVEDVDAFTADKATNDVALARVVDRYLSSPRFGERWGRHWLDVVRYADSVGQSWNAPFTYAWRYRDYVIDTFNADKPYDQFVIEQLAGDLLPATSIAKEREQRTATGFLTLGSISLQERSREQSVLDRVDDQIDVTSRAFLGLTVSCARCHDHKLDPVAMRDYYAWAGIFYSTRVWTGQGTLTREFGSQDYVDGNLLLRLPDRAGGRSSEIVAGIHSMSDFQDEWRQGKRDIRYTTDPNLAMGVSEGTLRNCEIRLKGQTYDRGDAPPRGDVRIPGLPPLSAVPADASGRLQLARWIVSPENPLAARVFVNRVWRHLFGRGLVRTPDEFGINCEEPLHRDLLDHLAIRFVADGWSVKKLIRSIMLSRVYRLDGTRQPAAHEADPQNDLYWRTNPRRLELEPLRDSLLAVAGQLTFERPAGIQVAGTGGKARGATTYSLLGIDAPYRTVYLPVLRSLIPEMFSTFDFPDPHQLQGHREVTTVAPQALFFMNSDFVTECARDAASLILRGSSASDADRVRLAYRQVLSRPPDTDELADALQLLTDLRPAAASQAPDSDRWTTFIQALMSSAEFRYVR